MSSPRSSAAPFACNRFRLIIRSLYFPETEEQAVASVTYDHVTKQYGEVVAVNDLDIHIEDKEFLVLVGP